MKAAPLPPDWHDAGGDGARHDGTGSNLDGFLRRDSDGNGRAPLTERTRAGV